MSAPRRAGIALDPDAHEALQKLTAIVGGAWERKITQSDAIRAMLSLARAHVDELRDVEPGGEGEPVTHVVEVIDDSGRYPKCQN